MNLRKKYVTLHRRLNRINGFTRTLTNHTNEFGSEASEVSRRCSSKLANFQWRLFHMG